MTNKEVIGTSADKPSTAHLFDWVSCRECMIKNKCSKAENRTGCRTGVSTKSTGVQ